MRKILKAIVVMSQSLPNQVNDFNTPPTPTQGTRRTCRNPFQTRSTTSIMLMVGDDEETWWCRNPFQTRSTTSIGTVNLAGYSVPRKSQSLPNQVNDFNGVMGLEYLGVQTPSQSLPNQVNDFNLSAFVFYPSKTSRVAIPSKPGQRLQSAPGNGGPCVSFMSQSLPNQVNDFNLSQVETEVVDAGTRRNPFQTRSTTSINLPKLETGAAGDVAIPSKPGQRLQSVSPATTSRMGKVSQSLPNQVNDFNPCRKCGKTFIRTQSRNPFQTRSTTSMRPGYKQIKDRTLSQSLPNQVNDFNKRGPPSHGFLGGRCRNPFQTRSTTSIKGTYVPMTWETPMSQSLPNQVNDFNGS